jgi:hypothetical protein
VGYYVSDRLLDGWKVKNVAALRERHLFYARHRGIFTCLAMLAAAGCLWFVRENFRGAELSAGAKLGTLVAAYMVSIHARHDWIRGFLPKELAVGILFSAGAALPIWSRDGISRESWLPFILFALLCALNSLSIERWENVGAESTGRPSPIPPADSLISRMALAFAGTALVFLYIPDLVGNFRPALLAILFASLIIFLLNSLRERLSISALRVLADVALVVTGLLALLIHN